MSKHSPKTQRPRGVNAAVWILVLLMALAMSACSDDANRTISGRVSLGAVMHSSVSLYKGEGLDFSKPLGAQEHLLLDSVITKEDGSFVNIKVGKYSGPMLLAVQAQDGSRYFDESANDVLEIPQENLLSNDIFPDAASGGYVLFAMLPGPLESVGITSLTTAATSLAAGEHKRGVSSEPPGQTGGGNGGQSGEEPGLTKSAVEHTNDRIREAMAPKIDSILSEPDVVDEFTTADDLDADEGGRYAAILAALADVGADADNGVGPAIAFLEALVTDLMDGKLDGGEVYASFQAFIEQFMQALIEMAERYGNLALQEDVEEGYEPTQVETGSAGGGGGGNINDYKHSGISCDDVVQGTKDGLCGTVDGKVVGSYVRGHSLYIATAAQVGVVGATFTESIKYPNRWNLIAKMDQATGTVNCDEATTEFTVTRDPRDPTAEIEGQGATGIFRATSCEVHYTREGDVVRGTFEATFEEGYVGDMWLETDIPPFTITNGHFHVTELYRGDQFMEGSYTTNIGTENEFTEALSRTDNALFTRYWPGEYASIGGSEDPKEFIFLWEVMIHNTSADPAEWTCSFSLFDLTLASEDRTCTLNIEVHGDHWAGTMHTTVVQPNLWEPETPRNSEATLEFKAYLPNGPVGTRLLKFD